MQFSYEFIANKGQEVPYFVSIDQSSNVLRVESTEYYALDQSYDFAISKQHFQINLK